MRTPPHRTTPGTSIKDRLGRAPRTRSVIAATGLLVLCVAPFAAARTGGPLREGVRNGTTTAETQVISNIASTTRATGGYSTRQSNLSGSGGGAVYGCRSKAGGSAATPQPQNPCVRANNLSTGLAFEFNASDGDVAGLISVGTGGDTKRPFVTNATGIATGLNADRVDDLDVVQILAQARAKAGLDADTVDGLDATDLRPSFAQVSATGTAAQSRGLVGSVAHLVATGLYGVTFAGDLSKCALSATLVDGLGQIAALPAVVAGNTAVAVRTGDSAGAPADHAFHLSVNC